MDRKHHLLRIFLIWLVATVILTPIVVFVLAPGMPPGNGTVESAGQVTDNTVLFGISTPVALAVLVYFGYALVVFRERNPGTVVDGPDVRGNSSVQFWWLIVTTAIVLFLAAYGSIRLSGRWLWGRSGPEPDRHPGRVQGPAPAPGPGHRAAVGVHLPLPRLRGRRDRASRAPDQYRGRVPRHLA